MSEAVHLDPQSEAAPPWLLEPPAARDGRFLMRDLSALLLDRHLRRLARMRNPLEMRLAGLLRRMQDLSGYLDLGFARLADYVTERLGLSVRRTQALLQLDRGLRSLPAIRGAFESGRISQSQVMLLLRVADPENEAAWLGVALGTTVRRLERQVRESPAVGRGEATPDPGADDDGATGIEVGFAAPQSLRARWDYAVELCRKASGGPDPVWQCAEHFAAEYLAGVPELPSLLARSLTHGEGADMPGGDPMCDGPAPGTMGMPGKGGVAENGDGGFGSGCAGARPESECTAARPESEFAAAPPTSECAAAPGEDAEDGVELFEEVLRAYQEEATHHDGAPSGSEFDTAIPGESSGPEFETAIPEPPHEEAGGGARELDARLRSLIRLRQSLAWQQGRLLRTFAAHALYRDLGFLSLGRYCTERLGIGLRRARRLIALEKHLLELPALAAAYRAGEVTWVQATEIARVATELDEKHWIRLARSVTVRRLTREAAVALARRDGSFEDAAARGQRRPGPPGLDPSGRVTLRSPEWPAGGGAGDDPAGREVQMSARGGGPEVQTSAPGPIGASEGWTRIRFLAPPEVAGLWRHALEVCRLVEGAALTDWQCAERLIDHFRATWEVRSDPAWQRRYRTFERDGWRCRVPGCSARRNLQEHHVVFRSQGGDDDPENLVTLCATHHLRVLHAGHLRCHRLPEGLLAWELGAGPDGSALVRYVEDVHWEAAYVPDDRAAAGRSGHAAGTRDRAAGPGNSEVGLGVEALHVGGGASHPSGGASHPSGGALA